ncbi:MAG TPA: DNA-formamidopyrimidine glycosylase family protein [Ilumatobacteraceae bacterium]|nr:DNA-formamidopyrimidine glycosylase family protein [Ilumatobacteraceae bacterium]
MPEGPEAEIWRSALEAVVGRTITDVWVDERVAPPGFADEVIGARIEGVRRVGKVVVLDGPGIGLHFGMTGRIVVDGDAPIERLEYASARDDAGWDRLRLYTDDRPVPAVRMNDPRRLGRVSLHADLSDLGVDITAVTPRRLEAALVGRRAPIKSVLLDQHAVAGLGNMCADEVLWWAGLDPHRSADSLRRDEIERLAAVIRRRIPVMLRRGGSHCGTLSPDVRRASPPCPRDGTPLRRDTIGGRTAVWCPGHQH